MRGLNWEMQGLFFFFVVIFWVNSSSFIAEAVCGNNSGAEMLQKHLNMPKEATRDQVLKALDLLIAKHAFRALLRPRTGAIYDVPLPMWLQGAATVQAARLKVASLIHRGFIFNEFIIPPRVAISPPQSPSPSPPPSLPPDYVVLVYRFFATRLLGPYCPEGYDIVGPVIGVKVYDGTTTYASGELSEVLMVAEEDPITVRIPILPMIGNPASTMCAFFDGNGSVLTTDMSYVNLCSLVELGDATLVAPSSPSLTPPAVSMVSPAPSPSSPWSSPASTPASFPAKAGSLRYFKSSTRAKIRIAMLCIVGAAAASAVAAFAIAVAMRFVHRTQLDSMELSSLQYESLEKAIIGKQRLHAAAAARTRALLERDYRFR